MHVTYFHQFLSSNTVHAHTDIYQIRFSRSNHQSSCSMHEVLASDHIELSSVFILYPLCLSSHIQVVVPHRFLFQESHSGMLTLHQVGKFSNFSGLPKILAI
ncbi:hypothetical protein ACOSQ4_004708 [Xanthoceras sorbifolium]